MTLTGVERDSGSSSSIDHNVTRVLNLTLALSDPSMHGLASSSSITLVS